MGHFVAILGTIIGVIILLLIYGVDWKQLKK